MRSFFSMFSGEGSMVRRSLLLAVFLGAGTLALAQGLTMFVGSFAPESIQRFAASSVPASSRNYTVTRSVLDDNITTGSISRVDPCKN